MKSFFAELKRRNVVRIAMFYGAGAWLILQVADVLLEIIDVPDGSLRLIALILALGFPFALTLAWAYELTPEGIKRDHEVRRDELGTVRTGRKLDIATIGVLVVAIALLVWQGVRGPAPVSVVAAPEAARDLSIAVLPFVNMSPDPDNEYFSDGLSEEVLNVLARMEDFRVAGRTSSFAFKNHHDDLRIIGERLAVAHILEGSVRKHGDRVRVTAQLIDTRSGYHLWSDTYDRELGDIFAIQDDIATEVVRALRLTLIAADEAVINRMRTGDVEAYSHYLRGQFHARLRTRSGLERALEMFQKGTLIDPDYAAPYAGIAMVYALLDNLGYRSLAETGPLANRALERALELDPNSDEAWAVRGLLLGQGPGAGARHEEARAALERAIAINPNHALAHLWLSNTLLPDEKAARESLQRAYELDPLAPVIVFRLAVNASQRADFEAFVQLQTELEEIAPDWFITWISASNGAAEQGRIADAAFALKRAWELNPDYGPIVGQLVNVLSMLGQEARAESLLTAAQADQLSDDYVIPLAGLHVRTAIVQGDMPRAVDIYREALSALREPAVDRTAELAMLEAAAGEAEAAESRVREALGLGADNLPERLNPGNITAYVVLYSLLDGRGEVHGATHLAGMLRRFIADLRTQGIEPSFMLLLEGYLDYRAGDAEALQSGLEAAIDGGYRSPPGNLRWILSGFTVEETLSRLEATMASALAGERQRYAEARRDA